MKTEFIWVNDIRDCPDYYKQMFGIREIAKELGGDIYWDNCDEWLLAVQGNTLLGFAGYDFSNGVFNFKRAFVFPAYRRLGIYKILFQKRFDKALTLKTTTLQAKTSVHSRSVFEKNGFFTLTKMPKRFIVYRKILNA